MEQTPPTFGSLAVPVLMLVCTTIIALIGFLLAYLLKRKDQRDDDQDSRIRYLELQFAATTGKRPSDIFKDRPKGESSA